MSKTCKEELTMLKKVFLSIVIIIGTAGTALAQYQNDVSVEFEGRYWWPELRANAQVSGETRRGTNFNFETDLGLADKNFPSGRFIWYTGDKSRLYLDYSQVRYESQRVLDKQIVFRDQTFDVGARVATDLQFKSARLGWIWQFINIGQDTVKLGTILEARAIMADITLEGQVGGAAGTRAEKTFTIALPTLGFALDVNPSNSVNIFFQASGMSFGRYGYFADSEAGIKLIPVRNFSISGGYRYEAIEGKSDHSASRLKLYFKGPFAGVSLRF